MLERMDWHRLFQKQKYDYCVILNTLLANVRAVSLPATTEIIGVPPHFVRQYNKYGNVFHVTKQMRPFMKDAMGEIDALKFVTLNVSKRLGVIRNATKLAFSVDGVMYVLYEVWEAYDENNKQGSPRSFVLRRGGLKDYFYSCGAYAPVLSNETPLFRSPALFCHVGTDNNNIITSGEIITRLFTHALMRGNLYGEWHYGKDQLQ